MKVSEYIVYCDLVNTLGPISIENPYPEIPAQAKDVLLKNRDTIVLSYFEDIAKKLKGFSFTDLFEYSIIYRTEPFKESDLVKFIHVIREVNNVLFFNTDRVTNELLAFQWNLLDFILHNLYNENEDFLFELRRLEAALHKLSEFVEEVSLLTQKLEHWGINSKSA